MQGKVLDNIFWIELITIKDYKDCRITFVIYTRVVQIARGIWRVLVWRPLISRFPFDKRSNQNPGQEHKPRTIWTTIGVWMAIRCIGCKVTSFSVLGAFFAAHAPVKVLFTDGIHYIRTGSVKQSFFVVDVTGHALRVFQHRQGHHAIFFPLIKLHVSKHSLSISNSLLPFDSKGTKVTENNNWKTTWWRPTCLQLSRILIRYKSIEGP